VRLLPLSSPLWSGAALEENRGLEWLGLDGNDITSPGIEFFPSSMATNATLRCLSLAMNKVGDDGASAIATMLTTLQVHRVPATSSSSSFTIPSLPDTPAARCRVAMV
jgi:hypothetical protein